MAKTWIYVVMTTTYEAGDNSLHQEAESFDNEEKALEVFNKKADAMHADIYGEADEHNADGISEDRRYRDYQISREVGTEFEYQGRITCECMVVGKDKPSFFQFCKDFILEHLEDWEGQSHYGCDLAGYLTEGMNADGTFTYSTYEAKEYIREWWDDAADYSEYEEMNFGKRSNPFENPEAFTVRMVIEGVQAILSKCEIIDENWNDKLELTAETIDTIKEQVEELDEYSEELF